MDYKLNRWVFPSYLELIPKALLEKGDFEELKKAKEHVHVVAYTNELAKKEQKR
jgi:hypothetical protein